jgi:putative hydrolase of the HAD superfamily
MTADLDQYWAEIDLVMLDMDGTLLDRYFDDYFWEHFVPEIYAGKNDLTPTEARERLLALYQAREGTLAWTNLDYWSEQLGLDIPALKIQVDHLINIHPYVLVFLKFCRAAGKIIWLVTNAHGKTLEIKMAKTALRDHFDRIICAEEVGLAKEESGFWTKLRDQFPYRPERTLLADDNEKVLASAEEGGIAKLVYVAKPSSRELAKPSGRFKSIIYFNELMPGMAEVAVARDHSGSSF